MCLIVFAWNAHPDYSLILTANRDEFYERPTAPASFWEHQLKMLAGKDLRANGTWMGITKQGKFAAVTNFRDPANIRESAKSRGDIPIDFLLGDSDELAFLERLHHESSAYNGFNVLAGSSDALYHYSNYEGKVNPITRGVHGLSNALLNTPWPKVEAAKKSFASLIQNDFSLEDLTDLMKDESSFPAESLPSTGIPIEWEKSISPICIRTPNYGTCSTTAITVSRKGEVNFLEQTYPVGVRLESQFKTSFKTEK